MRILDIPTIENRIHLVKIAFLYKLKKADNDNLAKIIMEKVSTNPIMAWSSELRQPLLAEYKQIMI